MRVAHEPDSNQPGTLSFIMNAHPANMMFPPVALADCDRQIWSVQVELPPNVDAEIRRSAAQDALNSLGHGDSRSALCLLEALSH